MKKILSLLLTIFTFQHLAFAQGQQKIDTLLMGLKTAKEDTSKVNTLNALCFEKRNIGEFAEARKYADEALALAEKIGFKKGTAESYNQIAIVYWYLSDYPNALEYHQKALTINEQLGNKSGIGNNLNGIGNTYLRFDDYPKALEYYQKSLKIREETGDKKSIAGSLHNIGMIYESQRNYPEALRYVLKAKKINLETGNKHWLSLNLMEIGYIFRAEGNYPEALINYLSALKIAEEVGNKSDLCTALNNIGEIYAFQGNYSEALKNQFAVLKISEEIGDKYSFGAANIEIGKIFQKQGKLNEALKYETRGLSVALEIDSKDNIKDAYENLAKIDSAMNNFKGAFENHKLYMQVNDSIFNMEKEKKLTSLQMQYEFDKKESLTKAVNEKELQKQKLVRNGFIGGFAVVLLFAGVFFRQRNKISKAKKISEAEKERSEELLLNILPSEVAEEIKATGTAKAKSFTMVTVMFTDFKDFTTVSEKVSAELLVDEIHTCFSAFDNILQKHKIEKIKTIGDAYLCASGLPVSNYTHATDMINAAFEIRNYMLQRKKEKEARGEIPFELRIGIHTGAVVAGIVGVKKYAYDIWGDTVNLAARMEQNSEAGKINISGSTYELVKHKFNCTNRGKIQAKNKGEIDMYFVETFTTF